MNFGHSSYLPIHFNLKDMLLYDSVAYCLQGRPQLKLHFVESAFHFGFRM